jgi:preprotein translocase subunit SecA
MNEQRKVIYQQRKELMEADDVSDTITDMCCDQIRNTVYANVPVGSAPKNWNIENLQQELARLTGILLPLSDWTNEENIDIENLVEKIIDVIEEQQKLKHANIPADIVRAVEKSILLQELDGLWKDHIASLEYMRHTIGLRAYGQKDPVNEYKKEAFNMFSDMLNQLSEKVAFIIMRTVIQQNSAEDMEERNSRQAKMQAVHESPVNLLSGTQAPPTSNVEKQTPFAYNKNEIDPNNPETWGKVARNDLCPCGSGKKYKKCCGMEE